MIGKRNCPICGEEKFEIIFHDKNRREGLDVEADFVRCEKCGMKYLTNIPKFENWQHEYSEIYESQNFDLPKVQIKKNSKKVLDIGCNFGLQLKEYYLEGYDVYGLDLNKQAIEDAKRNLPQGNFQNTTIEQSNYEDNFFDIIRTSHVLEHVYDVDSFIKKVYQILKPGGKFIVKVPNGNSLEMKLFGKFSAQSWIPFHVNLFTGKDLQKKLSQVGFKNIKILTKAIPWWWILSWRQWRNTINLGKNKTNFEQKFFHKIIMAMLWPWLWLMSKFNLGEELIVVAYK